MYIARCLTRFVFGRVGKTRISSFAVIGRGVTKDGFRRVRATSWLLARANAKDPIASTFRLLASSASSANYENFLFLARPRCQLQEIESGLAAMRGHHVERRKIHIVSGRDGRRTESGKSRVVRITTQRLLAALTAHKIAYRLGGFSDIYRILARGAGTCVGEMCDSTLIRQRA